jgi:hypothetical protein
MDSFLHTLIFIISVILFTIGVYRMRKYNSLKNWIGLEAIISSINEEHKDVALSEYTTVKYFYPEISYDYVINDHKYKSSTVSANVENVWVCEVDSFGIETKDENMFWRSLKTGELIEVFINPIKHQESVIVNCLSANYKSHNLALIVSGILIFSLWLLL